jgi:hypothetical protein
VQVANGLYRHQPVKVPQLQLWNESPGGAHAILHKNWDYPNRGLSKSFTAISCIHSTTRGSHACIQTIILTHAILRMAVTSTLCGWTLFTHNILWTDEGCFTCEGVVSIYNSHFWAWDNSHAICELGYQRQHLSWYRRGIVVGHCLIDN